jgi:hypothetical protein
MENKHDRENFMNVGYKASDVYYKNEDARKEAMR